MRFLSAAFMVFLLTMHIGCKKDDEKKLGNSGTASLSMKNATEDSASLTTMTPTVFGLKIVSVRLMVEADNCNTTECPAIWLFPGCDYHESRKSSPDGE